MSEWEGKIHYLWDKKETAVSRQVSDKDTPKAPSFRFAIIKKE